jgi:telomere length regulation protein
MTLEKDLEVLRETPTQDDINRVTESLISTELSLRWYLQVITIYLKFILPVYKSLKVTIRLKIRTLFKTCAALSQVLSQYRISKNEIFFHFTVDLLMDPTLLVSLIDSSKGNRIELQQVKSLMFGSKVFQTFEGKLRMDEYLSILAKQLVEANKDNKPTGDYILSYLSLHPIEAKVKLFNTFLTQQNFEMITATYKLMTQLQKRQFIVNYLIPYLASHTNAKNLETIASIINHLGVSDIEKQLIQKMTEIDHMELQQAVGCLVRDKFAESTRLISIWGDETYIKDTPALKQEAMTRFILVLLQYIPKSELDRLAKERVFLTAITARISSNDLTLRNLGMMIAKKVTSGEIEFDIQDEITLINPHVKLSESIDFTTLHINSITDITISQSKVTQLDSDDEESDDGLGDNSEQRDPVFLSDLLKRFSESSLTSVNHLLTITTKLVRQKALFGSELEFYSPELIAVLIGLLNKYEEGKFEELKLNAIISVIVSNPKIISNVFELLFTGDYSLQQRMMILSAVGLSARELRGFDDQIVEKPRFGFPTREIPQRKKLMQEVQLPKLEEIIENDEAAVDKGTVTWISSKLVAPKPERKSNSFAKHAQKFFYPLANGLSAGVDIGSYNEIFLKHYLSTMHLVLQAAYPCYGFEEMVGVYEQIRENSTNIKI